MKFIIKGIPPKKDRPRFTRQGRAYNTNGTIEGEARVRFAFSYPSPQMNPIESACKVVINAYYTPPKSWSQKKALSQLGQYKITKPDADNVIKAILDGLNGLAYKDDNLVAVVECCKRYAIEDYTEVEIIEL